MKALGVNKATSLLEDIEILEVPEKPVGETDVMVEIHSAGINPADWRAIVQYAELSKIEVTPRTYPFILGGDFSGVITKIGEKVQDFKVGDEVYGRLPMLSYGAMAEYVTIDQAYVNYKPASISHSQAATIPIPFDTAYLYLVKRAQLKPGQTILILGGAGGVGSMAVRIAKAIGARVIATGLTKDMPVLRELGVDIAIDSQKNELQQLNEKIDVMYDTVSIKAVQEAIGHMKDGGIVMAMTTDRLPESLTENETLKYHLFEVSTGSRKTLEVANELINSGSLMPVVERDIEFNAKAMAEAMSELYNNKKTGRFVLKIK